jgi:hypothetical protein
MLLARSVRYALAAGALAALAMTGAQAASIPATSTLAADTSVVKVHQKGTCWKGYYWAHDYCLSWGYNSYGQRYCRKWHHKRLGYCGGGSGGGSY